MRNFVSLVLILCCGGCGITTAAKFKKSLCVKRETPEPRIFGTNTGNLEFSIQIGPYYSAGYPRGCPETDRNCMSQVFRPIRPMPHSRVSAWHKFHKSRATRGRKRVQRCCICIHMNDLYAQPKAIWCSTLMIETLRYVMCTGNGKLQAVKATLKITLESRAQNLVTEIALDPLMSTFIPTRSA